MGAGDTTTEKPEVAISTTYDEDRVLSDDAIGDIVREVVPLFNTENTNQLIWFALGGRCALPADIVPFVNTLIMELCLRIAKETADKRHAAPGRTRRIFPNTIAETIVDHPELSRLIGPMVTTKTGSSTHKSKVESRDFIQIERSSRRRVPRARGKNSKKAKAGNDGDDDDNPAKKHKHSAKEAANNNN